MRGVISVLNVPLLCGVGLLRQAARAEGGGGGV